MNAKQQYKKAYEYMRYYRRFINQGCKATAGIIRDDYFQREHGTMQYWVLAQDTVNDASSTNDCSTLHDDMIHRLNQYNDRYILLAIRAFYNHQSRMFR